jgi:DivIVA domain-containing protein
MALTPEDVVNKRFQPTKFREGYDQDEVDDFLDEVVVELRRLNQENEELRSRLVASEGRGADGGTAEPVVADTAAASDVEQAPAVAAPEAEEAEEAENAEELAPAPVPAVIPAPVPAARPAVVSSDDDDETSSTSSLLQLARRLHDEHVREGIEKRDSLIAEAQATAERLLAEAEEKRSSEIGALETERKELEERIDGLRVFESEYRQQLKSYIEGQLRDLDSTAAVSGDAEHAGTGASGFSGFAGN